MVAANFFDQFSEDLSEKVHDLNADTLEIYLSNATPSASLDAVKADLAEITNENGYTAPVDTQNATSRAVATTSITGVDLTITASGGTVGPFRYAVLQNTTPTSPLDPLVLWYDYGSAITLQDGESFTVDFGASIFTVAPV
jgi:hypothetical protein